MLRWWRVALAALVLVPAALRAEGSLDHTDEVKAAFVLNIARFVEWPADQFKSGEQRLQLCLYRDNPLGSAIHTISGKLVAGRMLIVNTVDSASVEHACNILFVPRSELGRFELESEGLSGRPLLTVTDLTADGGDWQEYPTILVALVREGKHMGFEINLNAVHLSGLRVSSELLKLGRIVGKP